MKWLLSLMVFLLGALIFLSIATAFAQTPDVPVTYEGDTAQTIARRAQWIEAAKEEKVLVWWGNLRPDIARDVIADFNKVYPFIKVEYARQASEEKATKLEAEFAAGRVSVDVMEGGGRPNHIKWRKAGILRKFTDIVPNLERLPKTMYSKAGDTMMPGNNVIVPMYNTRLVSAAEAPKSWEDVLDPKWKGQIGMTADMKLWCLFALSENGWGVEKTERYLKKLKEQKLIWASGHTAGHMLMIAGEFKIMLEDYLYHALDSIDRGAPVEWIRANPVAVTGSAVTAMTKAPHINTANLFLEWLFSPQGFESYGRITLKGIVYPGSKTRQAKVLEGLDTMVRTEEIEIEMVTSGLFERFAEILGVKPSY